MKFLKIFAIIIISLVALFFIVGLFLPKTYYVSRSAVIYAPDSVLYNNVSNFNDFVKWNPWSEMEPDAKVVIEGTPSQAGHYYTWAGEETGKGRMNITEAVPNSSVDMALTFMEPWESKADTKFTFEPAQNGTKVTWAMSGNANSTFERWFYLNMDNMIGKDFDKGLKNLAEYSEK